MVFWVGSLRYIDKNTSHTFRIPIGDVVLHELQHDERGLVHLHEHAVVNLTQTQELQDLGGLRSHTVDTERKTKQINVEEK